MGMRLSGSLTTARSTPAATRIWSVSRPSRSHALSSARLGTRRTDPRTSTHLMLPLLPAQRSSLQRTVHSLHLPRTSSLTATLHTATAESLPLSSFDGLAQLLLVCVNLHRRTPHRGTASWPSDSE